MTLEINSKRIRKFTSMQTLNNTILKQLWIKDKVKGNFKTIQKQPKWKKNKQNGNTIYQKLRYTLKSILREKIIVTNIYINNTKNDSK